MKPFEEALESASADWVNDGVISDAQRLAILARHPLSEGSAGGSRFVAILATIGGLLLAVGISLLVKANWETLGDWVKIGGLVALMAAAYGACWHLKTPKGGYPTVGDAFLMVGALLFLAGIALVSQIFHLNARPATGVMIWWMGVVFLPWLMRAKGAQFVSMTAFLVWIGLEMGTADSWIAVDSRDGTTILAVYFFLGLAIWFSGVALRGTRRAIFAGLHEMWGFTVLGGALYWLGFLRHFSHWTTGGSMTGASTALILGGALAAVTGIWVWRASRRERLLLGPWLGIAIVAIGGIVFMPENGAGWLWSAAAWGSLFVVSVALVRAGIETGREGWVNLGVAFIALNIVTRYFDLFGTMLEGGFFFIMTGVLVIALGIFLERKRRALLVRLRKGAAS
jgi:uncharacterized membrane protein